MRKTYLVLLLVISILALVIYTYHSDETILDYIPDEYKIGLFENKDNGADQQVEYRPGPSITPRRTTTTTTRSTIRNIPSTPEEPTTTQKVYVDKRVPNFVRTKTPEYKDVTVTWKDYLGGSASLEVSIDKYMYEYYHSLDRYSEFNDYLHYINDENNRKILKNIADAIRRYAQENGLSDTYIVQDAIRFVQSIPYVYDEDSTGKKEFQKYPLETLYDFGGDCEDFSILLAGILKELGYGVILLEYTDHVAVGVSGDDSVYGTYYEYNGKNYFYVETTSYRDIGDMPEEYKGQNANILEVN